MARIDTRLSTGNSPSKWGDKRDREDKREKGGGDNGREDKGECSKRIGKGGDENEWKQ